RLRLQGPGLLFRPGRLRLECSKAKRFAQFGVELIPRVGILDEPGAGVLSTLPDSLALVTKPGTALLDDAVGDGDVQQIAFTRDAVTVEDVHLGFAERRRYLVLHDLDFRAIAHHRIAVLQRRCATNFDAHRGVEL